MGVAWILVT